MANVIRTDDRDGRPVLVYDNGMEKYGDTGHLIRPPTASLITSDTASDFHRARKDKKRAVVLQAANESAAVKREHVERFGELAFLGALTESAMLKATNSKDPKQIEAARFVLSESGLAETIGDEDPGAGPGDNRPRVLVLLAEMERRRRPDDSPGVIEGVVNGE
jgi:hypothetical protein